MIEVFSRRITLCIFSVCAFLVCGARAQATDISGTISSTLTINDDSELVGDVICNVNGNPCTRIGASGVTLELNGFTMTGQADPKTACNPGSVPWTFDPQHLDKKEILVESEAGESNSGRPS